ncbi:MAG: hypothetical protein ABFE08_02665 [Armatimonadia bacterium]
MQKYKAWVAPRHEEKVTASLRSALDQLRIALLHTCAGEHGDYGKTTGIIGIKCPNHPELTERSYCAKDYLYADYDDVVYDAGRRITAIDLNKKKTISE